MIVLRGSASPPAKPAAIAISPLVFLAFSFLFFALFVLLQEFAVGIDFDAPLLAVFLYHGFENGFAFFRLLLDFLDLVGASFILNCLLHRLGQAGHLNDLFFFFLCRKRRPSAKGEDCGYCYYWNDVFHMFCIFSLGLRGAWTPRFFVFARRAAFTRMRIRQRNCESFLGFNAHCLPPKMKSSKRVTLSAFVQTPTPPASLNVSSSTPNRFSPLKNTVKSLPENSTRNVLHLRLGTFASTP